MKALITVRVGEKGGNVVVVVITILESLLVYDLFTTPRLLLLHVPQINLFSNKHFTLLASRTTLFSCCWCIPVVKIRR
jgi:hypothetical protein